MKISEHFKTLEEPYRTKALSALYYQIQNLGRVDKHVNTLKEAIYYLNWVVGSGLLLTEGREYWSNLYNSFNLKITDHLSKLPQPHKTICLDIFHKYTSDKDGKSDTLRTSINSLHRTTENTEYLSKLYKSII